MQGWIGVDLDGTLADFSEGWKGPRHIGKPIPKMVERVRGWISKGITVKIMTARAEYPEWNPYIKKWLRDNGLPDLEITNVKDTMMIELWDDRARQVVPNTGEPVIPDSLHQHLDTGFAINLSLEDTPFEFWKSLDDEEEES